MITEQHLNQLPQIFTDVYHGNLDALEQYIQQDGDVNIDTGNVLRDLGKSNLFQFACMVGQDNIVERLLTDEHINPQANDNLAICWAAFNGHLTVVNCILEVSRNTQTVIDNKPICFAAANGHLAVVNRLIEVGCDPQTDNNYAIRFAAFDGHLAVVNRLMEVGCDPQARNNEAIRWAAENGHKKVVCALYDAAFILGNPIPRNITSEVETILNERIEYVSVMPMVFSNLARRHQDTAWLDVAPMILGFEDRLYGKDIKKVHQKGIAVLQPI